MEALEGRQGIETEIAVVEVDVVATPVCGQVLEDLHAALLQVMQHLRPHADLRCLQVRVVRRLAIDEQLSALAGDLQEQRIVSGRTTDAPVRVGDAGADALIGDGCATELGMHRNAASTATSSALEALPIRISAIHRSRSISSTGQTRRW